jgi:hypothetical protein
MYIINEFNKKNLKFLSFYKGVVHIDGCCIYCIVFSHSKHITFFFCSFQNLFRFKICLYNVEFSHFDVIMYRKLSYAKSILVFGMNKYGISLLLSPP